MDDKELLLLAAKAAGISGTYADWDNEGDRVFGITNFGSRIWNPLTDDGDALRLAVDLNLLIEGKYTKYMEISEFTKHPYAATRCAIVRAAAEIGKTL